MFTDIVIYDILKLLNKEIEMEENVSYVYAYLDHTVPGPFEFENGRYKFDWIPIYIGKGKNDRSEHHQKQANRLISKHKHFEITFLQRIKTIEKITGFPPKIIKIWENITEDEAFYEERKLILAIGTQRNGGPLFNKMCSNIYSWKPPIKSLENKIYILNHPFVSSPVCCNNYSELKRFCKQTKIDIKKMLNVITNKIPDYNGWKVDVI
jgi:hypothetical protein